MSEKSSGIYFILPVCVTSPYQKHKAAFADEFTRTNLAYGLDISEEYTYFLLLERAYIGFFISKTQNKYIIFFFSLNPTTLLSVFCVGIS